MKFSDSEFLGDKKKLKEIKKSFNIDEFNNILNSSTSLQIINKKKVKLEDFFEILEKITDVEISFYDEFTVNNTEGLPGFLRKISPKFGYEPIISFRYAKDEDTNHEEFGLMKCILNKKKDFQYYIISNSWYSKGGSFPQGDVTCRNFFNLNQEIDDKKLLEIMYGIMKLNKDKIIAQTIWLYEKLKWSEEKIKQYVKNPNVSIVVAGKILTKINSI
jgi:hypothetical protein